MIGLDDRLSACSWCAMDVLSPPPTSQRGRGRGVAKALKYATVAQAITLGTRRVRTGNDGENAPILHLNAEMGYRPIEPVIELHRELA